MDNFLDPRKKPSRPEQRPNASGKISYGPQPSAPIPNDDIGAVWDEQKRIRAQDKLLEIEYELAKEKARRLREQIKQNQIGEETIFGDDLKKYMPGYRPAVANTGLSLAKKALQKTSAKAQKLKMEAEIRRTTRPKPVAPVAPPVPVTNVPQPTIQSAALPVTQPTTKRRKPVLIGLTSLIVIAALGGGGLFMYRERQTGSAKSAVLGSLVNDASAVDQLYFPAVFPVGYSQERASASRPEDAKDVYIITLEHETDKQKSIFISQQQLPKDFNINEFNATLEDIQTFDVEAGRASAGLIGADNLHVVSIINQRQWIILNAATSVSLDDLRIVASGLSQ